MTDPYKVLGVSPSATEEEITQAYRKLAKKYHPDLHPGDKDAERKMQEINAAYEMLKKGKNGGQYAQQQQQGNPYAGQGYGQQQNPYGGSYGSPFGDFDEIFRRYRQWQNQQTGPTQMETVRQYIVNGAYQQALNMLAQMSTRGADWYYYSAIANASLGNRITALQHAQEAVRIDPGNPEYRQLLEQIEQGGQGYRQAQTRHGTNRGSLGQTMLQLCLAQMFCWFCCR